MSTKISSEMEIKKLPDDVTNRLRSDIQINTFPHCVTELVLNSLDAKSTAIAVRVNLLLFRIEVIDNGTGVSSSNMENIGIRYMTSKYSSNSEKKQKFHGYKGETLASIISAAKQVEITSRYEDSDDTYYKKFTAGKPSDILVTKQRPSKGTTVTIIDFLYNCPVRQQRVKKIDINDIQKNLELLAIIHPNVSFTLRDDQTCDIILNCTKSKSVSHTLSGLYKDLKIKNFCQIKVVKANIHITGLFYLSSVFHAKLQLFYINKLPVALEYLQKIIKKDLHTNLSLEFITANCYPVYVININCPYSIVDIHFDSTKYLAEFKSWNVITKCIEKMVKIYIDKYKKNKNKPLGSRIQHSRSNEFVKQKKTLGMRYKQKKKSRETVKSSEENCLTTNITDEEKQRRPDENFLGIFDQIYETQDFSFGNLDHNEKEGKKIIMDTFLKSLTGVVKKDDNEGKVIEIYENTLGTMTNKSFDKSEMSKRDTASAEVNFLKTSHERDISKIIKMSDDESKKRQLEKLNGVGTSLINKKLKLQIECQKADTNANKITPASDIESISWNSLKTKTSERIPKTNHKKEQTKDDQSSMVSVSPKNGVKYMNFPDQNHRTLKKYKSIGTSPIIVGSSSRRSFSNKEIQTNFSFKTSMDEKSVQVNLLKDDFKFKFDCPAVCKSKNNKKINILDNVILVPGADPLSLKHAPENLAPVVKNRDPVAKNFNTTFNSHYNASNEFNIVNKNNPIISQEKRSPFLNNAVKTVPVVEMDTQQLFNEITALNLFKIDEGFKCPKKPDHRYEEFLKGLKSSTPKIKKPTKISEVSTFFKESDFKIPTNANINLSTNKNTTVVFADTSMFNFGKDKFTKPLIENFQNVNETNVTFGHFEPVFKSTGREPKHATKNNYFQSFLFDETKNDENRENFFDFGKDTNNVEKQLQDAYVEEFGEDFDKPMKNQEPLFGLKKRYDFMPKGLSPILKETKVIDVTLSPTSKKQLNNAIIESYENELELIKWQDYIDGDDPREFFNKIYTEKQKLIQKDIPNVTKAVKNFTFSETGAFTKDVFESIVVIGQLDKKFIVTLLNSKVLLLFDQHAVHERIRLEQLFNDYIIKDNNGNHTKFKSILCSKFIKMQLNARELQCLKYCKDVFENLGFLFDIHSSLIEIKKIPECIHKKHLKEPSKDFLYNCIRNVLNEEISVLEETRGVSKSIPKMMQYIISNEACRGAIKFGQVLTNEQCSEYINLLSKCQLPFQCAHGRPTLYPIFEINSDISINIKINFHQLYP